MIMRILIVDDSTEIARSLKQGLGRDYTVELTALGQEAIGMAEEDFDAIVLDLSLPDISGIEVCKKVRALGVNSPILVLTADDAVDQKVILLDAGADDYITKPFRLEELKARLRALSRRHKTKLSNNSLSVGDLELDVASRRVRRGDVEIELRRKEFDLLECLMRNTGQVISRAMILDEVWGSDAEVWTNAIDVHIKYLRDKIDKPFPQRLIRTIHGVGYKIDTDG
jgi:two-component system, OmpR family, response regulator